jgi:hypothetical protein
MGMAYELVELSTGNVVGAYDTEQAALRDVAEAIRRSGRDAVASLALGQDDAQGDGRVIARGAALAALALAATSETTAGTPEAPAAHPRRVT